MKKKMHKWTRKITILILIVGFTIFLYVGFLIVFRYNPDDTIFIETLNNPLTRPLPTQQNFTISTLNVKSGISVLDLSQVDDIINNITFLAEDILAEKSDFIFLQELDKRSTRSKNINQLLLLTNMLSMYGYSSASNIKINYLVLPMGPYEGIVNQNLMNLSKYTVVEGTRVKLPVDFPWYKAIIAPDDAMLISRIKTVAGPELVLINVQIQNLTNIEEIFVIIKCFLEAEYSKGNYVILGGDFNKEIAPIDPNAKISTKHKELNFLNMDGFLWAVDQNNASTQDGQLRSGFLISDNINLLDVETLSKDFLYSTHSEVRMTFSLK